MDTASIYLDRIDENTRHKYRLNTTPSYRAAPNYSKRLGRMKKTYRPLHKRGHKIVTVTTPLQIARFNYLYYRGINTVGLGNIVHAKGRSMCHIVYLDTGRVLMTLVKEGYGSYTVTASTVRAAYEECDRNLRTLLEE